MDWSDWVNRMGYLFIGFFYGAIFMQVLTHYLLYERRNR